MKTTLAQTSISEVVDRLTEANRRFDRHFRGEPETRQPVHTVYGGAHLFRSDLPKKLGQAALRALDEYAPDFATFGRALGLPGAALWSEDPAAIGELARALSTNSGTARTVHPSAWLAHSIRERVANKLAHEPVEDFRIDFEDGFGARSDTEEDETAVRSATELSVGMANATLPPFIGIRIKSLSRETCSRALRTLDLFLTTLALASKNLLPDGFVVTLPKVTIPEQVTALVEVFEALERAIGLAPGSLKMELMVESTQSIVDAEGRINLPRLLDAAKGRCVGAHFGTYDYTASCNVTAAFQTMNHPSSVFARNMMQVAFSRTGIFLSDGATNVLPVPIHRAEKGGLLGPIELAENRERVHAAWRLHYEQTRASLIHGFYQGWDLHPAQLPVRYAAVYAFFLSSFEEAAARLKNFVETAARATLLGDVFDDAATGQGLLNYFLRALNCGALDESEVEARTGLGLDELRVRSFAKLVALRSA